MCSHPGALVALRLSVESCECATELRVGGRCEAGLLGHSVHITAHLRAESMHAEHIRRMARQLGGSPNKPSTCLTCVNSTTATSR